MPRNPVEAFLTTRAQIMSSYLQVVEGTARDIDMSYIFGTVVAPGPIDSIPYFYAASLGSAVTESTSMVQLVPSRYSGPTREIKIDCDNCGMSGGRMEYVVGEPKWPGYRAFLLGTPTNPTPESTRVVGSKSETTPLTHISGGDRMTTPISEDPDKVEDEEGDYDGDKDDEDEDEHYVTHATSGRSGLISWHEDIPVVPPPGEGVHQLVVRDPAPAATPSTALTSAPIVTSVQSPTNTMPPTPTVPPASIPTAAPPKETANNRPMTFLGNFRDFNHASLKLHAPNTWLEGMYVEGLLSISGQFGATKRLVGEEMCQICASRDMLDYAVGQAVCKVLVEEGPIRGVLAEKNQGLEDRCGFCLLAGTKCVVEA